MDHEHRWDIRVYEVERAGETGPLSDGGVVEIVATEQGGDDVFDLRVRWVVRLGAPVHQEVGGRAERHGGLDRGRFVHVATLALKLGNAFGDGGERGELASGRAA